MVRLSIIVPIYNVKKYLEECLESLLNQSLKEIEVIMINDGSTDKSEKIAEKFVIRDKRFKLINQENKGLSASRNKGIDLAVGKYIFFMDSDDFIIGKNTLEEMISLLEKNNSNIVIGKMVKIYNGNKRILDSEFLDKINEEVCTNKEFLLKCSQYNWAPACLYIYERKLIINNKLNFKIGFLHEDEDFTPRVILKSKRISIYNKGFYGYRQREGSITKTFSEKNIEDIIKILLELNNEYNNLNDVKLKRIMKNRSIKKIKNLIYDNNYLKNNKQIGRFLIKNSYGISIFDGLLIYLFPKIFFYKEVFKMKVNLQ